jgi:hypothetical protein
MNAVYNSGEWGHLQKSSLAKTQPARGGREPAGILLPSPELRILARAGAHADIIRPELSWTYSEYYSC